jgi:hypothetical protein
MVMEPEALDIRGSTRVASVPRRIFDDDDAFRNFDPLGRR